MATLDRLERYEGHFLNWYNTNTLEPLTPRYVSTVDSGNLLASLWVFERGCRDLLRAPLLSQSALRGIADTLGVLREETGAGSRRWRCRCRRCGGCCAARWRAMS